MGYHVIGQPKVGIRRTTFAQFPRVGVAYVLVQGMHELVIATKCSSYISVVFLNAPINAQCYNANHIAVGGASPMYACEGDFTLALTAG